MKESGLGWTAINIDDDTGTPRDLRNDIPNFDFSTPYNTQEVTGVDKLAMERLLLLADFSGTINAIFNPAANRIHAVMSGDMRIVRTLGLTVSAQNLNNEVLFTDYALTRAAGGELTAQCPFVLANGTEPTWT